MSAVSGWPGGTLRLRQGGPCNPAEGLFNSVEKGPGLRTLAVSALRGNRRLVTDSPDSGRVDLV